MTEYTNGIGYDANISQQMFDSGLSNPNMWEPATFSTSEPTTPSINSTAPAATSTSALPGVVTPAGVEGVQTLALPADASAVNGKWSIVDLKGTNADNPAFLQIEDDNFGGGEPTYGKAYLDGDSISFQKLESKPANVPLYRVTEDANFQMHDGNGKALFGQFEEGSTNGDYSLKLVDRDVALKDAVSSINQDDPAEVSAMLKWLKEAGMNPKEAQSYIDGNLNLDYKREQIKDMQFNRWMAVGKELVGLGTIVAQGILAFKQLNLQSRMLDIAESKERNAQILNEAKLEKEYTFKDNLLAAQKDIEKTRSSTEVAKAKISAKTKETKIKSDAMASLFFARRQYGYGSPAYA